jgi:hypothetical protein
MFGPWEPQISSAERLARCHALQALRGGDQGGLRLAHELLDRLSALNRRRLLASYAEMCRLRRRSRDDEATARFRHSSIRPFAAQAERVAPAPAAPDPPIAHDLDMMLSQMKRGSDTIWRPPTIG